MQKVGTCAQVLDVDCKPDVADQVRIHTHTHACTHTHAHAHTCTCTCTHTHTHTHTCTHTHTHTQVIYKTPVSIADNPKINQWLSLVEKEMRLNLATQLAQAVENISKFSSGNIQSDEYIQWVDSYQAQLVVLASQITWSTRVESALQTLQAKSSPGDDLGPLQDVLKIIEATLNVLADSVLHEQPPVRRKKLEHLVRALFLFLTLKHVFNMVK